MYYLKHNDYPLFRTFPTFQACLHDFYRRERDENGQIPWKIYLNEELIYEA